MIGFLQRGQRKLRLANTKSSGTNKENITSLGFRATSNTMTKYKATTKPITTQNLATRLIR